MESFSAGDKVCLTNHFASQFPYFSQAVGEVRPDRRIPPGWVGVWWKHPSGGFGQDFPREALILLHRPSSGYWHFPLGRVPEPLEVRIAERDYIGAC